MTRDNNNEKYYKGLPDETDYKKLADDFNQDLVEEKFKKMFSLNDQGGNPDLSESDAEKIRQQAGARIYSGKNQAKCSICGHEIPAPPGMCVACPTCGSNFGACG